MIDYLLDLRWSLFNVDPTKVAVNMHTVTLGVIGNIQDSIGNYFLILHKMYDVLPSEAISKAGSDSELLRLFTLFKSYWESIKPDEDEVIRLELFREVDYDTIASEIDRNIARLQS
ncbi:MAG: hypothetical protein EOP45_15865 [Sphingobacteriaceae bacterium]|nr:MAG: hypothetical protein EOP45_15865 [Sphingobacteriaceae bacterium]